MSVDLGERLLEWIRESGVRDGMRLPSERELADGIGWSRAQVRLALIGLEHRAQVIFVSPRVRFLAARTTAPHEGPLLIISALDATRESTHHSFLDVALRGTIAACRAAKLAFAVIPPETVAGTALIREARGAVVMADAFGIAADHAALPSGLGGLPIVLQSADPAHAAYDRVDLDQTAGGALIVHALAQRGARRLLRVRHAGPTTWWQQARDRGHDAAIAELGLEKVSVLSVDNADQPFDLAVTTLATALAPVLRATDAPDALVGLSDGSVAPLAAALRRCGRDPQTLPIAGFDHYWATCAEREYEPTPPACTVDRDDTGIGTLLVQTLLDRCAGRLPTAPQQRLVAPRLILTGTQP